MCGRYALSLRPSQVRQRLADQDMPANEAPDDESDQVRQTYNFAPGYHGLIYRADRPDRGGNDEGGDSAQDEAEHRSKKAKLSHGGEASDEVDGRATHETKYKLQSAKWGLVPFWTRRPPDYGSQMRTINCRDDSLIENRGMWNTMKQRKRCIVVAEGFYEWLKKNGGKEKIPHFVKRKDGQMMCFAGLWDMVKYEGSDDKLYTYTIITTNSNKQLQFLHDRMPVLLEPGSEEMRKWLDPDRIGWDNELQSMLKPFQGELECYAVDKAVGKVGNNSPQFIVPIDSKENKNNIANFFGKQKEQAPSQEVKKEAVEKQEDAKGDQPKVKQEGDETRTTSKVEDPETNAPLPKPEEEHDADLEAAIKASMADVPDPSLDKAVDQATERSIKREASEMDDAAMLKAESPASKKPTTTGQQKSPSPVKGSQGRKMRSATTNDTVGKVPTKEGNARITKFFSKGD
ncbi:DUF159 domain protein [Hortaea werneckii]|nr:DUF159 domain protein [Hortaea werneckii]